MRTNTLAGKFDAISFRPNQIRQNPKKANITRAAQKLNPPFHRMLRHIRTDLRKRIIRHRNQNIAETCPPDPCCRIPPKVDVAGTALAFVPYPPIAPLPVSASAWWRA